MKSTEKMNKKRDEMNRNPKVEIGNVELDQDEFSPEHAKARITMWVDLDVLQKVRALAETDGLKYQTWINQKLRETVQQESNSSLDVTGLSGARLAKRLLTELKELGKLKSRMTALERSNKKDKSA